jgi:asparagine N-glycosylation enzyme membrane subunit Stt3
MLGYLKNMKLKPQTKFGKWSIWLNYFFLITITISIILVNGLGMLSYDDHWWDVTVPIVFFASIVAFILGIIAIIKNKERSALVYVSVAIGLLVVLFIPLHSLFIND